MEKFTAVTPDVIDAVGEITNMVSGGAKNSLAEAGYNFQMATPIMITGQGVEIIQFSKAPVLQVPFSTAEGKFVIEANLAPTAQKK